MPEQLNLATPISSNVALPFRVWLDLGVEFDENGVPIGYADAGSSVRIGVMTAQGERSVTLFSDAEARASIKVLNKANLSTKSLFRRILEALEARKGEFTGTIAGTPDV